MSDIIPYYFMYKQSLGDISFTRDTFKVALFSGAYTPECLVNVETYSDLKDNEILSGNGYTTGGIVIGTSAYADALNHCVVYDCDNPKWTANGGDIGPFRYAAMYECCGDQAVAYVFDMGTPQKAFAGAEVEIKIDDDGLFRGIHKDSCK